MFSLQSAVQTVGHAKQRELTGTLRRNHELQTSLVSARVPMDSKGIYFLKCQLLLRGARVSLPGAAVRGLAVPRAGAPHAQRLGPELRERLLRLRRLRRLRSTAVIDNL